MMTLLEAASMVSGEQQQQHKIMFYKSIVADECPKTLKALQLIDVEYTTSKKPKGYNLVKRDNKKLGFVYYVRYWHNGQMLRSKWCTHTNDYIKACKFAEKNREMIITEYTKSSNGEVEKTFENYFSFDNLIFQTESKRNDIGDHWRKKYLSVVKNKFIPFLKENKVVSFQEITIPFLSDFQDLLLSTGMKSKSVNSNMVAIGKVLDYLTRKGKINHNPYLSLKPVSIKPGEMKTHGCYELEKVKGVFEKPGWNKNSKLLNLIIYSTGMRGIEIKRIRKKDIINISGIRFIDVKESKTENGVRIVPLHNIVYKKIMEYAKGIDENTFIFGKVTNDRFSRASSDLGKMLKLNDSFLKDKNITYYSGRHYWKTLMNAGGLGEDAEEYFMGHKVTSNVAKLYNHHDMQGKEIMIKKAKKVFDILDKMLFINKV